MKQLITEETILQMKYNRVQGRPAVVLENFEQYTWSEQQQINEAYETIYDLLQQEVIQEFSLSGAKANIKGKVAGAKAAIQGDPNAADTGKTAELQSLFDDLKKNIGTIVAQHEKDVGKLGFGPDAQISKSLAQIRQTIEASPAKIDIKDSSLAGKAGQFAADKVMPLVSKAIAPISNKIEQLYDKSGPIKDFDTKYQQLITQITQQNPKLAEPVAKFSEMAMKHKGKATFIIGGLTAILTATGALAAGGVGAFVIGVGLRGIYGLLAGEPPAKAFGKAAITAAIGKLVGMGAKELFSDVSFSGGDETMAKAGVGELTGGEEVAEIDPNDPNSFLEDPPEGSGSSRNDYLKAVAAGGEVDPQAAAEFQLDYAEDIAQQFEKNARSPMTPEMMSKMASYVKVVGADGSANANLDGIVVKGNIFLSPEEAAAFDANFQGMDRLSASADEWLRDNVESADFQLDADATADAARQAEYQEWFDSQTPEKQAQLKADQAEFDDTY